MPAPKTPPSGVDAGLAAPAKLIVVLTFMTQFIALLLGLGIYVPWLHERAVPTWVLILGSILAFAGLQVLLGFLLRRVPVRCGVCRARSYFAGFGWWPFIYRFSCRGCGTTHRIEVGAR
jgi:hypothetical protein